MISIPLPSAMTIFKISVILSLTFSNELANKAQGIIIADVTTAFDLKPALAVKLGNKLTAVSGRKVKLRTHLNKDIIGGIIVKIGDNRIDGSVTGRLQSLKAELIAKTH